MPNPVTSTTQPVVGPQYSGFNKSFKNLLSAKVGTLVPLMCDPVIPGTRVDLKDAFVLRMPPLASDTFMDVKFKQEAFFVPASSLYGGFNNFITKRDQQVWMNNATGGAVNDYTKASMIDVVLNQQLLNTFNLGAAGSLSDYLGVRGNFNLNADFMPKLNPLPFLAYHRIWDRFYRNGLITRPIFNPTSSNYNQTMLPDPVMGNNFGLGNLPWLSFGQDDVNRHIGITPVGTSDTQSLAGVSVYFPDGKSLFDLRQRNFGRDYFTNATPTAQKGDPATVNFTVDTTSGAGSISIAALRSINALQLFRERNNMANDDIHSYNKAHYNVSRTGYGESVPMWLGNHVQDVYSYGVSANANMDGQNTTKNPFGNTVGADYGRAECNGQGSLINGFEAPEFGYIVVLGSLVPKVTYSTGFNRHLLELVNGNGPTDIPDALLQQVGPQEVYKYELDSSMIGAGESSWDAGFGYQQRYAHYMTRLNELHGLFRDNGSLESFALQRSFDSSVALNTNFLEIPTTFLDQVAAVSDSISQFGYWLDVYFDYHVSMPLAAYSIPSLENPAGPTEWITRPGAILD